VENLAERKMLIHSLYEINFPTLSQPENEAQNLFNWRPFCQGLYI